MKIKSLFLTACVLLLPNQLPAQSAPFTKKQGYSAAAVTGALALVLGISDTELRHAIFNGTLGQLMKERGGVWTRKNWRAILAAFFVSASLVGAGVTATLGADDAPAQTPPANDTPEPQRRIEGQAGALPNPTHAKAIDPQILDALVNLPIQNGLINLDTIAAQNLDSLAASIRATHSCYGTLNGNKLLVILKRETGKQSLSITEIEKLYSDKALWAKYNAALVFWAFQGQDVSDNSDSLKAAFGLDASINKGELDEISEAADNFSETAISSFEAFMHGLEILKEMPTFIQIINQIVTGGFDDNDLSNLLKQAQKTRYFSNVLPTTAVNLRSYFFGWIDKQQEASLAKEVIGVLLNKKKLKAASLANKIFLLIEGIVEKETRDDEITKEIEATLLKNCSQELEELKTTFSLPSTTKLQELAQQALNFYKVNTKRRIAGPEEHNLCLYIRDLRKLSTDDEFKLQRAREDSESDNEESDGDGESKGDGKSEGDGNGKGLDDEKDPILT